MAMGRRDPQVLQEETVLLKLAKLHIQYFTGIFLTALIPSSPQGKGLQFPLSAWEGVQTE